MTRGLYRDNENLYCIYARECVDIRNVQSEICTKKDTSNNSFWNSLYRL